MKKIMGLVMLVTFASCGDSQMQGPYVESSLTMPSALKIVLAKEPVRVGNAVQVFLARINSSGQITEQYITSYADEQEQTDIVWNVSDRQLAFFTDSIRLVSLAAGQITVTAKIGEKEYTRTVNIYAEDKVVEDIVAEEDIDDDADDEGEEVDDATEDGDSEDDEAEPVACQTNAVEVDFFDPGEGAGFGDDDFPDIVLGAPIGRMDVLSLGRFGEIVLDLGDCYLTDGPGIDLIIFENPFLIAGDPTDPYAELGVVGLSEDGVSFEEFVCEDAAYPYIGCAGWNVVNAVEGSGIDPFDVDEAGGDHFDLADIGMEQARYIRIRDLDGTSLGGGAAGFDLDAISVVNGITVE